MMRVAFLAAILGLLCAASAHALECSEWTRLDDSGRAEALERMIRARLSSGEFEDTTSVRRSAVHGCLVRAEPGISQDFDTTCSQGLSAGMEALNRVFEGYVASCMP